MKSVSGREIAKVLERKGWILKRVNGSHHVFVKEGHPARISVPIHANKPLKMGLQRFLMRTAGIQEDEL